MILKRFVLEIFQNFDHILQWNFNHVRSQRYLQLHWNNTEKAHTH